MTDAEFREALRRIDDGLPLEPAPRQERKSPLGRHAAELTEAEYQDALDRINLGLAPAQKPT
jgi:hypothetical protein